MSLEGREVGWRRVALVDRESIFRMSCIQLFHNVISRRLGEYRGGADRRLRCIALHDSDRLGDACDSLERRQPVAIHLDPHRPESRGARDRPEQPEHCTPHGEHGRLQNVDRIDLGGTCDRNTPTECTLLQEQREALAFGGAQGLGVREPGDRLFGIENDGRGDDGTCERSAPGFIDTDDEPAQD